MTYGKPQSAENAPKEIHDSGSSDPLFSNQLGGNKFLAEWEECEPRHTETTDANRYADDCNTPDSSDKQPR